MIDGVVESNPYSAPVSLQSSSIVSLEPLSDVSEDWGKETLYPLTFCSWSGCVIIFFETCLRRGPCLKSEPVEPGDHVPQYANDTLMLLPPDLVSIRRWVKIQFYIFEFLSGLSINFTKSSFYPLGPSGPALATVSACYTAKQGAFLSLISDSTQTDCHLQIGLAASPWSVWQKISCLERHSSRGGRLILIKSVLTNLPLYFMSFFYLPPWVVEHIDKLRRAFFWKGERNVTWGHGLINWETFVLLIARVVLKFADCEILISLLSKWWWKLLLNHPSPWVMVVLQNYYHRCRPLDLQDKLPGRVSHFCQGVLKTLSAFKIGLRFCCGQGTSVKFWKDCWLGELPLKIVFPNPFDVAADKDAWDNNWAISFCHPLFLTRLQMLALLIGKFQGHTFQDIPDQVIWKAGSAVSFTVSSQYKLLQAPQPQDTAAKHIWKTKAPLKVKNHQLDTSSWSTPTGTFLQRRHIRPPSHCVFRNYFP